MLWFRTAELTTGVLCVSCPEIGPLFRKRERGAPTASVLNGNYSRETTNRRRTGRGLSKPHQDYANMDSETYLELQEGRTYDVQVTRDSLREETRAPGEVYVTHEYRVDSCIA